MTGSRTLLPSRGIVLGLIAAVLTGLIGSWAGRWLTDTLAGAVNDQYVSIAAAFVVGAIAGVVGRHLTGLAALWLGLLAAATLGGGIAPPDIRPVPSLWVALIVAGTGYALGRMVDPLWGGRPD